MMKSYPENKLIVVFVLFMFLPACTNTIAVPISKYNSVDSERVKYWHVRTVGGNSYSVKRFSINNSELLILDIGNLSKPGNKNRSYTKVSDSELPLTISLEEIDILEYVEISHGKTALAFVGLAGIAAGALLLIFITQLPFS